MQKHYTHFSENERHTLYKMRKRNYSLREIARCLERDVSTFITVISGAVKICVLSE